MLLRGAGNPSVDGSTGLRAHLWWMVLAALLAMVAAYAVAPGALARDVLHPAVVAAATASMLLGIRLHRPSPAGPWVLIAAGTAVLLVAVVMAAPSVGLIETSPTLHEALEAGAFVCYLAAGWWMLRHQVPRGERESLLDGLIVMLAVLTLLWALVPASGTVVRFEAALSQLVVAAVVGALARMLLLGGLRLRVVVLLLAGVAALVAGDALWTLADGGGFAGGPTDQLWGAAYAFGAAAALHPSMRELVRPQVPPARLGRGRLAVFGVALLAGPAALTLALTLGHAGLALPLAGTVLLVGLVLGRVARLHALRDADARYATILARLGRAVVEARRAGPLAEVARAQVEGAIDGAHVLLGPRPAGTDQVVSAPLDDAGGDAVVVRHPHPHRLDAAQRDFLQTAATLLASGLRRVHAEQRLEHQAAHDALTGLPNRLSLDRELSRRFGDAADAAPPRSEAPPDSRRALLLVDLDGFKDVNDGYGHHAGDTVLRIVAERMSRVLREDDLLTRFAGDEFVVVADGLDADGASRLAERLIAAVGEPVRLPEGIVELRASVGVCLGSAEDDADALFRSTDAAMYHAKHAGGGRWHLAGADR